MKVGVGFPVLLLEEGSYLTLSCLGLDYLGGYGRERGILLLIVVVVAALLQGGFHCLAYVTSVTGQVATNCIPTIC